MFIFGGFGVGRHLLRHMQIRFGVYELYGVFYTARGYRWGWGLRSFPQPAYCMRRKERIEKNNHILRLTSVVVHTRKYLCYIASQFSSFHHQNTRLSSSLEESFGYCSTARAISILLLTNWDLSRGTTVEWHQGHLYMKNIQME